MGKHPQKLYRFSGESRLWGITQIHQLMPPIKYTELERVWKSDFFFGLCASFSNSSSGKRISNKMYFLLFYYCENVTVRFFFPRIFIGKWKNDFQNNRKVE